MMRERRKRRRKEKHKNARTTQDVGVIRKVLRMIRFHVMKFFAKATTAPSFEGL